MGTHSKISWLVKIIINVTLLSLLASLLLYLTLFGMVLKVAKDIDFSGGIKPLVETAWCGKKGCLDK